MTNERDKQQSQPKQGEPVEIPVPEREDVLRDLRKMGKPAAPVPPRDPSKPRRTWRQA